MLFEGRNRNGLKVTIQVLIIGVVFYFLGKGVYKNWTQVSKYEWHLDYFQLIVSTAILLFALTLMVIIWRLILGRLGAELGFKKAWKIWFYSNMGRYIPGKVWQIVGMVYLCQKENISKIKTTTSIFLAQALSIMSALFLMIVYLTFIGNKKVPHLIYLLFLLIPIGLFAVYPSNLERLINFGLEILKKGKVTVSIKYSDILFALALYFGGWIIYGSAFYFFANSVYGLSHKLIPVISCIFATAYALGYLSFITPGGLGVREGILASLLSTFMPLPMATIISILSRVWFTLAELICLGIGLKL